MKDIKNVAIIGVMTVAGMVILFALSSSTTGMYNYGVGGYEQAVCTFAKPPAEFNLEQCTNYIQQTCNIMHNPYLTVQSRFDKCYTSCLTNGINYCNMYHNK